MPPRYDLIGRKIIFRYSDVAYVGNKKNQRNEGQHVNTSKTMACLENVERQISADLFFDMSSEYVMHM